MSDLFCRYDLKLDSAILAEAKHLPLYKELVDKYQVRPHWLRPSWTQPGCLTDMPSCTLIPCFVQYIHMGPILWIEPPFVNLLMSSLRPPPTGAVHRGRGDAERHPCGTVDERRAGGHVVLRRYWCG